MQKIHLIIPAAGESSRMGSPTPKQFSKFHGKTILEFVESIFSNLIPISSITVALNKNQKFIENLGCQFSKKTTLIDCGGSTRAETVLNALEIIEKNVDKKDPSITISPVIFVALNSKPYPRSINKCLISLKI